MLARVPDGPRAVETLSRKRGSLGGPTYLGVIRIALTLPVNLALYMDLGGWG